MNTDALCMEDECSNKRVVKGRCRSCHGKVERWGSVAAAPGRGNPGKARPRKAPGRRKTKAGYILVRREDKVGKDIWVLEHRLVMEAMLARPLMEDENVHHKNGIKDDNRPENLELWCSSQPTGQRVEDLLEWAREITARYAITAA